MHPEPKTLQEALEVIQKKDLKIERLEKENKELKEENERKDKLLGNKRNYSQMSNDIRD